MSDKDSIRMKELFKKAEIKETKIQNKKNENLRKNFKNNIMNLKSMALNFKQRDIPELLNKFSFSLDNEITSIKKFKEFIYEKYFNPGIDYSNVNLQIRRKLITDEVVLVLSGGGARGAAHIGVLKRLEELNIKPKYIVGTSVGSIVGSLYASGLDADQLLKIFTIEQNSFYKMAASLLYNQKKASAILRGIMKKYLGANARFSDLQIPFFVNTSDIKNSKRIVFQSGTLIDVVMGSAAIPFVFDSVEYGNNLLMDGGVCDNFCVDIAKEIRGDENISLIISDVSAATDFTSTVVGSHFLLQLSREFSEFVKKIGQEPLPVRNKKDLLSIMNNLLYLLRQRGGLGPENVDGSEIIVTPLLENMKVFDFHHCIWANQKGYETAKSVFTG